MYAQATAVSADRSKAEIEAVLRRYGASQFVYGWNQNEAAMLGFRGNGRSIRIVVPMPDPAAASKTPTGRTRRPGRATAQAHEQEIRRRWRALLLVIKAKLEAVASGIAQFDDEFLAYTVLRDGQTFGEWAAPQLPDVVRGKMPTMLAAVAGPAGRGSD